ncbi:MAG TPA: hypothetical protein VK866_19790, partial [Acidimicrobiales bacterium]|nr:hypothetical protein [Acidimicrobiales bacterium]
MTAPRILLTASALDQFGPELRAAAPDAVWLALDDQGGVTHDGAPVGRDEVAPDVAWLTSDLVQGGALRPVFGIVVRAEGLRWLQSSAAVFDAPV